MRIGQPATVISDIYGDDVEYHGKVVGLDMGTGSASRCCQRRTPPVTGSVVQRLPVRIELDPQQVAQHPLRIGLSTLVKVDTQNKDGAALASNVRTQPRMKVTRWQSTFAPVNQLIADIVRANAQ